MAYVYPFRKGRKQDLPSEYHLAAPLVTLDSAELFVGQGEGKPLLQINANLANSLYGLTADVKELNYLEGANDNIQVQLDNININKLDKSNAYDRVEIDEFINHIMVNKVQIADFEQGVNSVINALKGVSEGIAPLDVNGQIPLSYIGAIGLGGGVGVNSEEEQLALASDKLIAIRADINKTFVRNGQSTGTMDDWIEVKSPTSGVNNVAGKTGNVVLTITDITGLIGVLATKSDFGHIHDYKEISNKPDLSSLHSHFNLNVLNKFSETGGNLQYNGTVVATGNMVNNYKATIDPNNNNDFLQGYTTGSRWINLNTKQEFVCIGNDIGSAVWKPTTNLEGDAGVPKLLELTKSIVVPANSSLKATVDSTFLKYDLRTLYARSLEGYNISVAVYDSSTNGFLVYQSLTLNPIYDIINIPCVDKEGNGKMDLIITNTGAAQTTVELIIKITNLL